MGLTEDPAALKRFLVCAPLVGELCKDFEASFMDVHGESSTNKLHAESLYMQQRFLRDNESLLKTISTQGNPFNASQKEIVNIYTHEQSPSSSLIYQLEQIATTQYEKYLQDVFVDASRAIYVEIKQNNIKLFPGKNIRKDKTKVKLQSVQTCNKLVTNLFIASQQ